MSPFFLRALLILPLLAACAASPVPPAPGSPSLAAELRGDVPVAEPGGCITRLSVEGREYWFASLCPKDLTPDLVATLHRALAARGLYRGPAGGTMTAATRQAVLAYQTARGVPSDTLSRRAAQQMGLIPWID